MSKPFPQQTDDPVMGSASRRKPAEVDEDLPEPDTRLSPPGGTHEGEPGGDLSTTRDDRLTTIRNAAYLRAQARGFEPGYELDDWLWAERELQETVSTLAVLQSQTQ